MQPFSPGQVWTYDTRPGERASRVVICRVETDPAFGEVVHIYVNGLQLKNPHAPGGVSREVTHLPYKAESLRQFLVALESTGAPLPPFDEGYREWRASRDHEGAGVFTVPLAVILGGTESGIAK